MRELRMRAVMNQEQLAQRSGVARDTISKLESGRRRAYPVTVRRLAAGLEVEPRVLVEGSKEQEGEGGESGSRKVGF